MDVSFEKRNDSIIDTPLNFEVWSYNEDEMVPHFSTSVPPLRTLRPSSNKTASTSIIPSGLHYRHHQSVKVLFKSNSVL
ncbi:hypothetical protein NPIL_574371 [Nephila pilipes]|uniref:Uncharacterized protein n=1 Tax=Nephila pilipes TaxID=299642 RepID=A0A8X6NDA0_NEPPI|nr:hypothetical protein NPIL_574371 [Nephila pilipes]